MNSRLITSILTAVAALAVVSNATSPAQAQAAITGSIRGSVTDDSGNFLPGARLALSGAPLGDSVRTTITDAEGNFLLNNLRVGVYSMTASMMGYRTVELMQIIVNPDSTRVFDIRLPEGLTEKITVFADQPLVDKGSGVAGHRRHSVGNHASKRSPVSHCSASNASIVADLVDRLRVIG